MHTRNHHRARFAAGALVALSLAAVAVAKGNGDLSIDNPPAANTENPLIQPTQPRPTTRSSGSRKDRIRWRIHQGSSPTSAC